MRPETEVAIEPAFVAGHAGQLLTMVYRPIGHTARGALLVIPPFAEEMNRVRRSVALVARAVAQHGFATVITDLYGTGDSEGEFADARWETWCEDLAVAARQSRALDVAITHVLGIRCGALLALDAMGRGLLTPRRLILWNPVAFGRQYLDQFLRLRVAADMAKPAPARTTVEQLRRELADGACVEVSGYELHPLLVAAIDRQELTPFASSEASLSWIEVTGSQSGISPAARQAVSRFEAAGWQVTTTPVFGPQVWSTPETTVNDLLNAATVAAVSDAAY